MAIQIRLRRGTAAEWTSANSVLSQGEVGVETDTSKIKVGDGSTAWNSLAYQIETSGVIDISTIEKGGIVVGTGSGTTAILPVGSDGTILGVDSVDSTTVGWVTINLSNLSGTSISSPTSGDLLQYNGTSWVNSSYTSILQAHQSYLASLAWGDSAGYFSRGNIETSVYKWAFPADTVSTTTAAPGFTYDHAGFANPSVAGYFSRGINDSYNTDNTVYKWAFPADTVSTTTAAPANMAANAGFANPAVAGYFSQGFRDTTVYKWAFPADTVTTTTAAPAGMLYHDGFANPAVAGYFSRGVDDSYNTTTTVYKWTFPADTVTTTTSAPASMDNHAGFANPAVAGYFSRGGGGFPSYNPSTTVYKWAFPADTVTTTTSAPASMDNHAGFANPSVAGYFSRGGLYPFVYKWSFPADTVSTTTSAPNTMYEHAGFANGY